MKHSKYIDHSLLTPFSTLQDIQTLCQEAIEFDVAAVCIKPDFVKNCVELLKNTSIKIATVIGFPHGGSTIETKCFETQDVINNGAQEIDMVVNIGRVIMQDWKYVHEEILQITQICKKNNCVIKVIFETTYISKNDIATLCKICSELGVDFVKTSTGFDYIKDNQGNTITMGAQIEDIDLMRENILPHIQIKASGGIRNAAKFLECIEHGATRIGTSATKDILKELKII